MTTSLIFNNSMLTELAAKTTGLAVNPENVASSSFFIIQPGNLDAVATIQSGGNDVQTPTIPAGFPIPYPVSSSWNNNTASVTNGSVSNDANFGVGYFGMPAQPNICTGGEANLNKYQNTTFRTTLQPLTLTIKASEPAIAAIIIGSNMPLFVALNVDGSSLTGPYADLIKSGVMTTQNDGTYTNRANFSGATVTVVNVSNSNNAMDVSLF